MHSFDVHSNESACRKKVCLGLEKSSCRTRESSIETTLNTVYISEIDSGYVKY